MYRSTILRGRLSIGDVSFSYNFFVLTFSGHKKKYYSTYCNIAQIRSQCSRDLSLFNDTYPVISAISFGARGNVRVT